MINADIKQLRTEIARVDEALASLIAKRVDIARKIGAAKRASAVATLDHAREANVVRRLVELSRSAGLKYDEEVRGIAWQLIGLARKAQMDDSDSEPRN
jgi:chorismate mutase